MTAAYDPSKAVEKGKSGEKAAGVKLGKEASDQVNKIRVTLTGRNHIHLERVTAALIARAKRQILKISKLINSSCVRISDGRVYFSRCAISRHIKQQCAYYYGERIAHVCIPWGFIVENLDQWRVV
ncbi:MAG: hypothetical protein EZS28_003735 [Streblomastix strix]|uniref:Uncharacterized protein n=1 Tax=Streblomastix strix TaxID=222440 RepID=A0A5J4X109_9EUKA|nr:MAG: hypothetical protein EZS28_003735 [Streblomastix strix]